ncbi:MAG: hypothetical protein AB1426_12445 [Bacillota bacterium]
MDPILGEKVEQEIARLIMTSPDQSSDQVENWAADLEVRVRQAKEAEERLQDLIMDRSSFRMDKVHEVLGNAVDTEAFAYAESLVVNFLRRFPTAEVEPLAGRTWRLRLPPAFVKDAQEFFKIDLKEYEETKAIFEPQEAGKHEEWEFLAFGHPLFDAIVEYCRTPHFIRPYQGRPDLVPFGLAAAFRISSPEYAGKRGWFFLFEAQAKGGICQPIKVIPLFVCESGEVYTRIADHILHQLCHHKFEEYEEHIKVRERIPYSTLPGCFEKAKQVFQDLIEQMGREWNVQNKRLAEEELNRIDRCYRHLIARAQADLERERTNLENVRKMAVTEQQRKILPALEGRVRRVERKITEMQQEWERKRESITSRVNLTVESGGEPICAAYVELVG